MNETASDSMIDIQIEESLVRETLMTIDSANFREDAITLFGFVCIIVLSVIIGIYGPRPIDIKRVSVPVEESGIVDYKNFVTSRMTTWNRFLSFALSGQASGHVVGWEVVFERDGVNSGFTRGVANLSSHSKDEQVTVPFFYHFVDDVTVFRLRLRITGGKLSNFHAVLNAYTGDPSHTILQLSFRLVFALSGLLFLVTLSMRLRSMPFKLWHVEQKVTIPLLFLTVLYCNPFYIFFVYHPSPLYSLWNGIFSALFFAYARFFILVLFGSFRYANKKIETTFFVPKLVYALVLFAASVFKSYNSFPQVSPAFALATYVDHGLYVLYLIWFFSELIRAVFVVDVTDLYKLKLYVCSACVFIAASIFVRQTYNSSLSFTLLFSTENVFALFMAYCHWPYEVMHDGAH